MFNGAKTFSMGLRNSQFMKSRWSVKGAVMYGPPLRRKSLLRQRYRRLAN